MTAVSAPRMRLFRLMRDNGIVYPRATQDVAEETGIPLEVLCAFLEQESGGGNNVWGHDDTWMVGWGEVTHSDYKVYKAHAPRFGRQGCGPMQLTYGPFQDMADREGGCWLPRANILVGARLIMAERDKGLKWREVYAWWNHGPDYPDEVAAKVRRWRAIFEAGT